MINGSGINLNVEYDYQNEMVYTSVQVSAQQAQELFNQKQPFKVQLFDGKGIPVSDQMTLLTGTYNQFNHSNFTVSGKMGYSGSQEATIFTVGNAINDTYTPHVIDSFMPGLPSSAYPGSVPPSWQGLTLVQIADIPPAGLSDGTIFVDFNAYDKSSPKRGAMINDVPILVERGDSVFHGAIEDVSGNTVTFRNPSDSIIDVSGKVSGQPFNGFVLEIISGQGLGEQYPVLSNVLNGNQIDIGGDVASYTGSTFKVMPYMSITGYNGWVSQGNHVTSYFTDVALETGLGTVSTIARFDSFAPGASAFGDVPDTNTFGQVYRAGQLFGLSGNGVDAKLGIDLQGTSHDFACMFVVMPKDEYGRDPIPGDVLKYRAANAPSQLDPGLLAGDGSNLGIIYSVVDQGDEFLVGVAPSGNINQGSESGAVLYRHNQFRVMNYPQFGSDITAVISTNYTALERSLTTGVYAQNTTTPGAMIDMVGAEYASPYANVTARAHFHFGPVRLTNGQVLDNRNLKFSGEYFTSDPTAGAVTTWQLQSTQNPTGAANYGGEYSVDGVFVTNESISVNQPDILRLGYTVNLGSASVSNVTLLPVQPGL